MRIGALLLTMAIVCSLSLAQKRYVVSAGGDVIPINKNQSAKQIVTERMKGQGSKVTAACTPSQEYGNIPSKHTFDATFQFGHQDVCAVWFEAPAAGTLDSMFIFTDSDTNKTDQGGKMTLRIFHSNIYSTSGPGNNGYLPPPKVCWGWFNSTNDLDAGIAPYIDDATDTTWQSTYNLNNKDAATITAHFGELADTTLKSFPPTPLNGQIWGLTGVDVPIHPNTANGVDLGTLGRPTMTKGEPFFVSFKDPGNHPIPYTDVAGDPNRVLIRSASDGLDGDASHAVRMRFNNWKFYEHASFCGPGWLARGEYFIYIWYTMSVTSDVPPDFNTVDNLGSTISEAARPIFADITDCNFAGGAAGVDPAKVYLHYSVNEGAVDSVLMSLFGGSIYTGEIPGAPCPSSVSYYISAVDNNGNRSLSNTYKYDVLCLRNNWVYADTGASASTGSIAGTGTVLDTTHSGPGSHTWFVPTTTGSGTAPLDDGTAGPFAIGNGGFLWFGDTMHYAWIGINGGIALSKAATDTVDVNVNGFFSGIDLPSPIRRSHTDTVFGATGVPRNLIMGMWADFILGDTTGQFGNIRYQDSNDHFVAEWDSIGTFDTNGSIPDETTFRIVLNKADGTIEFQYDNVGVNGTDSACVVGVQSDSTNPNELHGYFQINRNTYPYETKPRAGWVNKFWPVLPLSVQGAWNMVSVPGTSPSYARTFVFPSSISQAFSYDHGYSPQATLANGPGYWVKFTDFPDAAQLVSGYKKSQAVSVQALWNMIGSVSFPVSTASVVASADPGGNVASQFFGYNGGYSAVSSLTPGSAYWVKVTNAGTLTLNAGAAAPKGVAQADDMSKMNQITVTSARGHQSLYLAPAAGLKHAVDYYDMPPAPPQGAFDARFVSGRMLESFPASSEATVEYSVKIQSSSYPVTISWNMNGGAPEGRTFTMTDGNNGKVLGKLVLNGSGSMKIDNPSVSTLIIRAESGINIPTKFDLSQNYPNPFNPTTRMQMEMPKTANVSVAVYDVLGRKVATLADGVQSAGFHTVEWNGQNEAGMQVPSGTYFVRMMSDEFNTVKKIMLMK